MVRKYVPTFESFVKENFQEVSIQDLISFCKNNDSIEDVANYMIAHYDQLKVHLTNIYDGLIELAVEELHESEDMDEMYDDVEGDIIGDMSSKDIANHYVMMFGSEFAKSLDNLIVALIISFYPDCESLIEAFDDLAESDSIDEAYKVKEDGDDCKECGSNYTKEDAKKDAERIEGIVKRADGDKAKETQLAKNMAKAIKDKSKLVGRYFQAKKKGLTHIANAFLNAMPKDLKEDIKS